MKKLDKIVKDLLETHVGGEIFFNHLDEVIRSEPTILDELIQLIPSDEKYNYVVSGQFGLVFANYYHNTYYRNRYILTLPGNLRHTKKPIDLSWLKLQDDSFIFIDDSFYLGRTRHIIDITLQTFFQTKIESTYVVYDGSKQYDPTVHSLYRFHKK